jgi:transposase
MYQERIRDTGESKLTARRAVGTLLDINPATLRNWVEREEIDSGARPGVTTEASDELKALRREVAELRRANEILKTASAFFASAELCATRRDVDREVVRDHFRWAVAAA